MLPIFSSSSSVHSLISKFFCSISSSSSIESKVCLLFPPFYLFQFHSNLPQYSLSYLLSNHPNNFFAVNPSGSSSLLNVPSSLSCLLTSSISHQYSFSNSSTASFTFSKFSFLSQVSDSAVNPFYLTKYLSFPLICCLFRILFTSHSSFLSCLYPHMTPSITNGHLLFVMGALIL